MIRNIMTCAVRKFRLGLIQLQVSDDKAKNLERAVGLIKEAKEQGSALVVLPECFNSPYGTKYFPQYAETIPDGETCCVLSEAAKKYQVYLVGGSIPEKTENKFYNTSTVWNPKGELIACHRKVHLFDIDVKGGIKFMESEVLSPGEKPTIFDTGFCKVGLGICYDVRFSELSRIYRKEEVNMLIYPGAFNMTTGPLHWELLMRARANDEQLFVAAVAPAQDPNGDYKSYGHTMLVDPWGKVVAEAEFQEELIVEEVDMRHVVEVREQIPTFKQRRTDIYDTVSKI